MRSSGLRVPNGNVYLLALSSRRLQPRMKQDYYADLGILKTASEAEIKTAYRRLVLEHHPDKQGDPVKFRAAAEAYDVLGDPVKRQAYDTASTNARIVDLKGESSALVEEYFRQFAK
jgi:molecular chaperone DnaJ